MHDLPTPKNRPNDDAKRGTCLQRRLNRARLATKEAEKEAEKEREVSVGVAES